MFLIFFPFGRPFWLDVNFDNTFAERFCLNDAIITIESAHTTLIEKIKRAIERKTTTTIRFSLALSPWNTKECRLKIVVHFFYVLRSLSEKLHYLSLIKWANQVQELTPSEAQTEHDAKEFGGEVRWAGSFSFYMTDFFLSSLMRTDVGWLDGVCAFFAWLMAKRNVVSWLNFPCKFDAYLVRLQQ